MSVEDHKRKYIRN